jgi:hypothetical protein
MARENRISISDPLHPHTNPGRRTVLRTGVLAFGAALLPASTLARTPHVEQSAAAASTWDAWRAQISALRATYLAEVERLAEELRPRFEAGELRAMTGEDLEDGDWGATSPFWKVGEICAARFGCAVTRTADGALVGDIEAARLVLLASPRAESQDRNATHPCYPAKDAAAWDVIAVARERGMYVPGADEDVDPLVSELRATA